MRRHLQHIAVPGRFAILHSLDLLPDRDQSIDEAVQFLFALGLSRLDHERVGDGPAHGWRVEAVVLQPLGNVDGFDAGGVFEAAHVEDEFVRAAVVGVGVEDGVVRAKAGHDVVCVEEGDLCGVC